MSSVSHDSHSPRSLARTPQVGHSYISHCSMSTLGLIHEYKKCSVIYLLWQLWYSHRIEARGFPRGAARGLCILDRTLTETIGILVMICIQAVKATTPRSSLYRVSLEARRGVTCLGLSIRLDLTDYHRSDSPTKDEWSSDAGLLCDTGDLNSTLIFVWCTYDWMCYHAR
jgi:hypothetical protein